MRNQLIAAVALVVAAAGGVSAQEYVSPEPVVNATATVSGVCESFRDGVIAFSIDQSTGLAVGADVSWQPKVKCTNQTVFTVLAISQNKNLGELSCAAPGGIVGTLQSRANTADAFDYTFTCGTATGVGAGFGDGKEQDVGVGGVAGVVTPEQYARAVAHTDYWDTITLVIHY